MVNGGGRARAEWGGGSRWREWRGWGRVRGGRVVVVLRVCVCGVGCGGGGGRLTGCETDQQHAVGMHAIVTPRREGGTDTEREARQGRESPSKEPINRQGTPRASGDKPRGGGGAREGVCVRE